MFAKNTAIAALMFVAAGLTACSKKDDTKPTTTTTTLTAVVDGAQQVPTVTTSATGTFTGTYTSVDNKLEYTVTYQGLTPNMAHIHLGAPGATGAVAIPFATLDSPIKGSIILTAEQADKLLNNGMYVNIHTAANRSGEIRGDIKKQ